MTSLSVKNLHFSYTQGEEILGGISLDLDNRPTAIIGQNGAGKTTFVKLLKGLLRPNSGEIYFNGEDIANKTVAQLAGDIGLIFQNPNDQIFKNTVLDEVLFGPLQIGMEKNLAENSAKSALELVGLWQERETNPYDLGLSDRKLVSIAAILAMNPQIIIFDEPTIAQDYQGKEKIKHIMRTLADEGKIVISILHDMDFVAEVFDRVVVFAQGDILLDGDTKTVFSAREILEKAHLEQPNVTQLCGALGYQELFLTTEEFVAYYQKK